jgi:MFS superfamily sulfate permease-like transporter
LVTALRRTTVEISSGIEAMFNNLKNDLPASVVVFFVALPLCLGIALASGAPLISGLIAGVVGGIVVGMLSGSQVGVTGPAAGLAAIVLVAITDLGGFENFLVAVVLAGFIQIALGMLRAGVIGYYFPSSVIKGMLTGIGLIIILKQIPHFFGYGSSPEADFAFFQSDGENTFSAIASTSVNFSLGATLIASIALAILLLWDIVLIKRSKIFQLIQGPLVAVVVGVVYFALTRDGSAFAIAPEHLVNVPKASNFSGFIDELSFPNFAALANPKVWIVAGTVAVVASLETLLCLEATDKLDPQKRVTPTNRELLAQGAGNVFSGLIGGLPMTQVIVRSSANIQSGAKTKLSAILHGILLLGFVVLAPGFLNMIPLSVLAAILFIVGYKLAKPALFIQMYQLGFSQFLPFIVTVLGIVFTNLLAGIGMGLAVSVVVILYNSYRNSHFLHREPEHSAANVVKMTLAEEVTFFNKASILVELDSLADNSNLELDVSNTRFLDHDIIEILDDFAEKAKMRNINIKIISEDKTVENPTNYLEFFRLAWR